MKDETLISVSPVVPVYNKKGKVTGWRVSAKYMLVTPMGRPSQLRFHSIKTKEYSFRGLFGWGYKLACRIHEKMLAKIQENKKSK